MFLRKNKKEIIASIIVLLLLVYYFMPNEVRKDKNILDVLHVYNIPYSAELMLQTDGPVFHYQTKFLTSRVTYMLGKFVNDIPNTLEKKNQLVPLRGSFFSIPEEFHNTLIDMFEEYNIKITGNKKILYSCVNNLGDRLETDTYSMLRLDNGWSLEIQILPHNIFIMYLVRP